jgi:YVTN family beta-propeller protein
MLLGMAASACGRQLAKRYQGWLYVASGSERCVTVADLAEFRRMSAIPLPQAPDFLFASETRVFAASREGAALFEIDPVQARLVGRIGLQGMPETARLLPDGVTALILTDAPPAILVVDLAKRRVAARLPLPAAPADMDVSGKMAAVTFPSRNEVARIEVPLLKTTGITDVGAACGPVRFRKDGKLILAGATAARQIVTLDAQSGALLARLPVPIAPARFCFNGDGGQMFVSGEGADVVAIVSPYQSEVGETIIAGRTPGAMAVSDARNLLFVTNPGSGDLTILDIDTRHLSASVHVGEDPGEVLLTPDGEYALVVDRRSGNVSVVRITTVLDHKVRAKPLFTVFATAADARSAIIVPYTRG